ncbi:helix-turn-helix domain-containing protein [Lactiplantibacillus plantarum]|uniref:helix-turn-helix domain-containing protein n=1 Tax=Lactiplantibacillus plantarum TaxID=1590 RepID=UPI003F7A6C39
MNTYSRIKELADAHKISISELERTLKLSNGSVSKWAKSMPNSKYLTKVADYFDVSTDYLLGRTNKKSPDTNEKSVDLFSDDYIMTYQGKPIPPEDMEYIKRILNGGKD